MQAWNGIFVEIGPLMMETNSNESLVPIRVESAPLRSKIIEAIRDAIEHGTLKPGSRLIEKDLCERLEVSRTSLREALRELEAEGIVARVSARGLTVVKISRHDAANIYRIRAQIEALIFQQFTETATDAQLLVLNNIYSELISAYNRGTFFAISQAKASWHTYICEIAQNQIARNILSRLTLRTAQLRNKSVVRKERQKQSIVELGILMEAIKKRDSIAAGEAARLHVMNASASALTPNNSDQPE
jgi:DNA-binding GntR family transcriptional regulator